MEVNGQDSSKQEESAQSIYSAPSLCNYLNTLTQIQLNQVIPISKQLISECRRNYAAVLDPEPSSCLGVFGLSKETYERDLVELLSKHGRITKCVILRTPITRESRGYGFINFESVEDAKRVKMACRGMPLHGRCLRLDFSTTQGPHDPTPGIYKKPIDGFKNTHFNPIRRQHWVSKKVFYKPCFRRISSSEESSDSSRSKSRSKSPAPKLSSRSQQKTSRRSPSKTRKQESSLRQKSGGRHDSSGHSNRRSRSRSRKTRSSGRCTSHKQNNFPPEKSRTRCHTSNIASSSQLDQSRRRSYHDDKTGPMTQHPGNKNSFINNERQIQRNFLPQQYGGKYGAPVKQKSRNNNECPNSSIHNRINNGQRSQNSSFQTQPRNSGYNNNEFNPRPSTSYREGPSRTGHSFRAQGANSGYCPYRVPDSDW